MDHEFSSAPLESDLAGWDWFSLQLSNNTELMVYLLRKKDGSISARIQWNFRGRLGEGFSISVRDVIRVDVLDHWQSPRNGAVYPSALAAEDSAPAQLDLIVHPKLPDQELQTPETTKSPIGKGVSPQAGSLAGNAVSGEGYVELTGYAGAMDDRM